MCYRNEVPPGCEAINRNDWSTLDVLLGRLVQPNGGCEFTGDVFRMLSGPVVYLFLCDRVPMYVGMSAHGLSRVNHFDRAGRKRDDAQARCDKVQVWPCRSAKCAKQLEAILIDQLKPQCNATGKSIRDSGRRLLYRVQNFVDIAG
jgi:hypothetical protein